MDVEYFHLLMTKFLMPRRKKEVGKPTEMSSFYHDHATNSSAMYEKKFMDKVCGEGHWMQFSPTVCREDRGKVVEIKASEKRRGHSRRKMEQCLVCECKVHPDDGAVTSVSPELNQIGSSRARSANDDIPEGPQQGVARLGFNEDGHTTKSDYSTPSRQGLLAQTLCRPSQPLGICRDERWGASAEIKTV